jgi:ribose transport system ATP-binding protein
MTSARQRPRHDGRRPDDDGRLFIVRGLSKAYAVPVLIDVDLDLRAGEVHALMGANGAGKSTLVRIVCGLAQADGGTMTLAGDPYGPLTRRAAEAAGVQVVLQELTVVSTLTVAENLCLARLPHRFGVIDRARLDAMATRALEAMGVGDLDPRTPVASLGVGQRQLVEIAAALSRQCRVLVLDEPTAALTSPEVDRLFGHVRRLCDAGIAVLYITHRMHEVTRIADRVTVLRDGRVVDTRATPDLDHETLVSLVTGEAPPSAGAPRRHAIPSAPIALRVEGLCRGSTVHDVSFDVHAGEILGLSGLVGAGRTEVLRAIYGADVPDAGRVQVAAGVVPPGNPGHAVAAGIGLVPEDRQGQALFQALSLRSNVSLASLPALARARAWIDRRREAAAVSSATARVEVRAIDQEQPVGTLSGGNQQKVVLARWLLRECSVLLVDEPTRGIDFGAKHAIHRLLRQLADRGTALVVVSSEIEELMAICDRIVVMRAGRVTAIMPRAQFSEATLMAAAFGVAPS